MTLWEGKDTEHPGIYNYKNPNTTVFRQEDPDG
jgi:hypothetical protein